MRIVSRRRLLMPLLGTLLLVLPATARRAAISTVSRDPYMGALVVSAEGEVLFEDNADAQGYPASMVKLMNLLLILENVERGALSMKDPVVVTADASNMGGTQVFLKEHESFPLEDMLYAMMVQSANDAAVALAIKVAGSKEGFVDLMNRRAAELGMRKTRFHSVHGLPPAEGQEPDVSTPRDMARLGLALLRRSDVLPFTSTLKRPFRTDSPQPFIMENHNRLLGTFEGCDGLKTGYIKAGGDGIAATAQRGGKRVLAIVMGSLIRETRDAKTRELLATGLNELARKPAPPPPPPPPPPPAPADEPKPKEESSGRAWMWGLALVVLLGGAGLAIWVKRPRFNP